jgi:hypothetical protein
MPGEPHRHWTEAIVCLLGALPVVVTWFHVYSDTPQVDPQPTWSQTVVLVVAAVIATFAAGWSLRKRLRSPWLALVAVALAGPILVVASGVIRTRAEPWGNFVRPVVGAWGAAAAYLFGTILVAIAPVRPRMFAAVVPLAMAFSLGHVAYGLPAQVQYDIVSKIAYPHPNEATSDLLYGGPVPD